MRFHPRRRRRIPFGVLVIGLAALTGGFFVWRKVRHVPVVAVVPVSHLSKTVLADAQTCSSKLATSRIVGIQAGHWQIDQVPDELASLRYDFGTASHNVNEVDVNLDVAQKVVALLKAQGVQAEVLPATVPAGYCANAFVAIHADGNDDTTVHGYKVAASEWDGAGKAQHLSDTIDQDYEQATDMHRTDAITENMTQYYAFNYEKFTNAIDEATPGAIIELGFITNASDRARMANDSQTLAQAVAQGILDFLNGK